MISKAFDRRSRASALVSVTLLMSMFAAQAGLVVMSPLLAAVAHDLGTSTAAAGQLRTITGLTAGVTALLLSYTAPPIALTRQLLLASLLLAIGSIGSAAAPSFAVLAVAQVPVGIAVAVYTTAGLLAAAEWVPAEQRTTVLSWALIGQPAAWVVGMPLVGVVGERSWRYGWVALPLVGAVVAGLLVARRTGESALERPASLQAALTYPGVRRWLGAELLANTAWATTIVYAGALFVEAYGASTTSAGLALAVAASAYIVGNRLARRLPAPGSPRALLAFAVALALTNVSFGAVRESAVVSVALFSAAAFAAGGRTLVSSSYGLSVPAALRPVVMGGRTATMQFGYFAGSSAGGLALLGGGFTTLGILVGALFLAAAGLLLEPLGSIRGRRLRPVGNSRADDLVAACTP